MRLMFRLSLVLAVAATLALPQPAARAMFPATDQKDGVPTLAPLLRKVTPGVVNIAVKGRVQTPQNPLLMDPFFRRYFDLPDVPQEREIQNVGSGVIVDAAKGHILTNHHVVANADEIMVTLTDRRRIKAKLVGTDPATDIALLQVQAEKLVAVPLGDSDTLEVGDFVIAIGNPFGLGQTVTSGIVSALGRGGLTPEGYEDFIQTDASINPGNSGGALISLRGELVGINTAIIAPGGGNVGIGFAVPANMARSVMRQLLRYGEVRRGWLGVSIQDLTAKIGRALGIARSDGAVVTEVAPGSPADKAGLRTSDVIIAIDGKRLTSARDLRNRIGLAPIGTKVRLTIIRDDRERTLTAIIGAPAPATAPVEPVPPGLSGAAFEDAHSGNGVLVAAVEPGSSAWWHGLREGDIIFAVNRRPARSVEEFRGHARKHARPLALDIRRGGRLVLVVIP
jgi:serine protease Do/serine protease DegQ